LRLRKLGHREGTLLCISKAENLQLETSLLVCNARSGNLLPASTISCLSTLNWKYSPSLSCEGTIIAALKWCLPTPLVVCERDRVKERGRPCCTGAVDVVNPLRRYLVTGKQGPQREMDEKPKYVQLDIASAHRHPLPQGG
jgi:hypothetical protein